MNFINFFQNQCMGCNCYLINNDYICDKCIFDLKKNNRNSCYKCSRPLVNDDLSLCVNCQKETMYFEYGFSLYEYNDFMKKSIYNFKYNKKPEYAKFYASEIIKEYKDFILKINPDCFVPIPLSNKKMILRGFNQAEVLANEMSVLSGIKVVNLFKRIKHTSPMKNLTLFERKRNLSEVFKLNKDKMILNNIKCVIIVDDIYTTGTTINYVSNILNNFGVKVYFITVAIATI